MNVLLAPAIVKAEPLENVRYVNATNGNDSANDCLSAAAPCRTIQRAINQAQSNDTILVASGTYTYAGADNPCDQFLGGLRAVVCIVNKQLTLKGGYPSGDWSAAAPANNPTIIDGENRVRGVYVLSSDPNRSSQAGIQMEGFTVRQGYFQGASSGNDAQTFAFGGGMLTDYASVVLRNMRFENNTVLGGGDRNEYGGSASGGGAAIRRTPSRATIENVVFVANRAEGGAGRVRGGYGIGAGLYLLWSELNGSGLEFYENNSQGGSTQGDGRTGDYQKADAFGAGLSIMGYADVTLSNVVARNNHSRGGNAGVNAGDAFGGAIKVEGTPGIDANGDGVYESATLRLFDCDLTDNSAQGGNGANGGMAAGGALETIHSTLVVERCNIQNNTSQGGDGNAAQGPAGGGGLYLQNLFYADPTATVRNSVIAANRASAGSGSAVGGGGGAIWLQGVAATIVHNTIVGNQLLTSPMQGSAILVMSDGAVTGPQAADIRYNIISDHSDNNAAALHVKPSNTANLSYNLFYANASNINTSQVGAINGMGTSVLGDPRFVNTSAAGNRERYRILAASAAVDQAAGSPETVDTANDPRNGVPDVGAYESVPFQIRVFQVSSESVQAYWGQQPGIEQYLLTVGCPRGANRPNEVACDSPQRYPANIDGIRLTGMTNFVEYTISVSGENESGVIVISDERTAIPTDIFVFMPTVIR
jgi:hypothetical protein